MRDSASVPGALDQASEGDGRWGIAWTPVQCPVGTGGNTSHFYYSFQGSNPWYLKLQIANARCGTKGAHEPQCAGHQQDSAWKAGCSLLAHACPGVSGAMLCAWSRHKCQTHW